MHDIFLSYASPDRERIRPLVTTLENQGWTVWWDRRILPGQSWDDVIAEALAAARCVVVVWTQAGVASEWVRLEANIGRERDILAPALLEEAQIPLTFRHIQAAWLITWDGGPGHPEILSLVSGVRSILGRASSPQSQPKPALRPREVTEPRAVDAAIARELPVREPANLIAMIRRADSAGLKAILQDDDEYGLSPEDVASKPFELTFPTDAEGSPLPAEILLRVNSPEFDPPRQEKKIRVAARRDSTVCSFLLTPMDSGQLVVQLELYQGDMCVASRILRPNGVPVRPAATAFRHQVVTMPLTVNVKPQEFTGFVGLESARAASAPESAAAPPATTESFRVPPAPEASPLRRPPTQFPQAAPPPPRPSAPPPAPKRSGTWMKAGLAAAIVLISGPLIYFQLSHYGVESMPSESPAVTAPPPVTSPSPPSPEIVEERRRAVEREKREQARPAPTPERPRETVSQVPPPSPDPKPEAPANAALQEVRERTTVLVSRAAPLRQQLRRLREELAKSGQQLRADVATSEWNMDMYLGQVQRATELGDAAGATRSLNQAEREIRKLEEFLGR